jgi:hypothetical protein
MTHRLVWALSLLLSIPFGGALATSCPRDVPGAPISGRGGSSLLKSITLVRGYLSSCAPKAV